MWPFMLLHPFWRMCGHCVILCDGSSSLFSCSWRDWAPRPLRPALYVSASLSQRCLHIKMHLTSISVKETGASGFFPVTSQRLLLLLVLFGCRTTHLVLPAEGIFRSHHFLLSSFRSSPYLKKTSNFCCKLWQHSSWTSGLIALLSHSVPLVWIAIIYGLLKRVSHNGANHL